MSELLRRRGMMKRPRFLFYKLTDTTGDGKMDFLEISNTRLDENYIECSQLLTQYAKHTSYSGTGYSGIPNVPWHGQRGNIVKIKFYDGTGEKIRPRQFRGVWDDTAYVIRNSYNCC